MQDLRITLVQAEQVWEDKKANLAHFSELLRDIPGTDLILLPEMFHTGFSMHAEQLAESMRDSLGIDWLKATAQSKNCAVYTSLIIRENGHFYNRGIFMFPDGNYVIYDKRKTFGLAGEDKIYAAGTKETIVDYKGWKINLQICYDLRFPEIVRNSLDPANQNARYDVILYVANWPERRSLHWKTLLQARAIENQCYVAGVNRIGTDIHDLSYSGDSMIIDALGNVTASPVHVENVFHFILNSENLEQTRLKLPFLKDAK